MTIQEINNWGKRLAQAIDLKDYAEFSPEDFGYDIILALDKLGWSPPNEKA